MGAVDWDLLSSYAGLLSLAVFSIYTGSFGSLPSPPRKSGDGKKPHDADEDEDEQPERLSSEDAWLFPLIGSALLFGLYVIVKYFGREWINWILQWYFTIAGVGSGSKALISLVRWLVGPARWRQYETLKISVSRGSKELLAWSLRTPSLYMIPFGALPSLIYTFGPSESRKSALLTDVLALSFSYNALCFLTLDSFKTGCILLSGLFLYDVWWVFGTEVMVKVATNLDVPIKILWPKSLVFSTARGFTMLGLGDIVVPGMFVALALRYDQHRAAARGQHDRFAKPYFYAALAAYLAGLGATMAVMHVFKAAQPALLYLSPACILSFAVTALVRGELKDAWSWNDQADEHEMRGPRPSNAPTPLEMSRANSSVGTNGLSLTSAGRKAENAKVEGS